MEIKKLMLLDILYSGKAIKIETKEDLNFLFLSIKVLKERVYLRKIDLNKINHLVIKDNQMTLLVGELDSEYETLSISDLVDRKGRFEVKDALLKRISLLVHNKKVIKESLLLSKEKFGNNHAEKLFFFSIIQPSIQAKNSLISKDLNGYYEVLKFLNFKPVKKLDRVFSILKKEFL